MERGCYALRKLVCVCMWVWVFGNIGSNKVCWTYFFHVRITWESRRPAMPEKIMMFLVSIRRVFHTNTCTVVQEALGTKANDDKITRSRDVGALGRLIEFQNLSAQLLWYSERSGISIPPFQISTAAITYYAIYVCKCCQIERQNSDRRF